MLSNVDGNSSLILSLVGIITHMCMGMRRIFYIGIGYPKRYSDAIMLALFRSDSLLFTTLHFYIRGSNRFHEKCLKHNVVNPEGGVHSNGSNGMPSL